MLGKAKVYDNGCVFGEAEVNECAVVKDSAEIYGAVRLVGNTVMGNVTIF